MKITKRMLAMLLTLLMSLSVFSAGVSAYDFSDVPRDYYLWRIMMIAWGKVSDDPLAWEDMFSCADPVIVLAEARALSLSSTLNSEEKAAWADFVNAHLALFILSAYDKYEEDYAPYPNDRTAFYTWYYGWYTDAQNALAAGCRGTCVADLQYLTSQIDIQLNNLGTIRAHDDPTEPPAQLTSPQGVLVDDPNYLLPPGATLSVTAKNNIDSGVVSGNTIACWDITILKANGTPYTAYPLSGKVELLLPVPSTYTGNINSLKVYHNGVAIPKADCTAVTIEGKQYIKVLVDSFSPFALVEEAGGGTTTATTQKWWEKLPSFVQWLLRIFAFGWIWMK